MKNILITLSVLLAAASCSQSTQQHKAEVPFVWENANIYFLLTDRFNNGDPSNDVNFERTLTTGKLRGFEGGDLKGITQKINEGYFSDLGITAIWMTPIVEQIHGGTDEGTGLSYGYHGYWASDWTAIDPNFGTKEDLKALVDAAHQKGIRILLDAVINHTGPVTAKDPVWPEDWVRTAPQCSYDTYLNTVTCTLVKNLPDIRTDRNDAVALPPQLVAKWKTEGRYEQEVKELDAFFERTGYPRAPRFYIMKWLTDYITEFGIDGYRVDTAKHTEAYVWQEFKKECDYAFEMYKKEHPDTILDELPFYLVGEVYHYGISTGQQFNFSDRSVNYYENAFKSLINFEFKWNIKQQPRETVFYTYDSIFHTSLKGYSLLNYIASHDDGAPFDPTRVQSFEAANMLLMSPGAAQVYYGDETARPLQVQDAVGDANLRSNMNWDVIQNDPNTQDILQHWQKLGRFRAHHPAIGAGKHQMISEKPYLFSRKYAKGTYKDEVVVGFDLPVGKKEMVLGTSFEEGTVLLDAYSQVSGKVTNGKVTIESPYTTVLLSKK